VCPLGLDERAQRVRQRALSFGGGLSAARVRVEVVLAAP